MGELDKIELRELLGEFHKETSDNYEKKLRNIIHEYVGGVIAEHSAQLEVIDVKLNRIEEQTKKTNGSVAKIQEKQHLIELESLRHQLECPQAKKIITLDEKTTKLIVDLDTKFTEITQKIDNSLLPIKFFSKYPWFLQASLIVIIMGVLIGIYKLIQL